MRFVDTNIFIYSLTGHPAFGLTAKRILERIENGEEASTSSLVLLETAWVLEAMGRQGDIETCLAKILSYESLEVMEITCDDLLVGANNMTTYKVDFNDGINIALMARRGISEIYSNDQKHLGKIDFLRVIFK